MNNLVAYPGTLFAFLFMSFVANGETIQTDTKCATVSTLKCRDTISNESSEGFSISNNCDRKLKFFYEATDKTNHKSFKINELIEKNKLLKHCAITANSDHIFGGFKNIEVSSSEHRMNDLNLLISSVADNVKTEDKISIRLVERSLDLNSIPNVSNRQDFENNAQRAWAELLELRNSSAKLSQMIILRNAEYYVMGYYAGLSKDAYLSFGINFGDGYMALKWAAQQSKFTEPWVRSNPAVPSSPIGGTEWARAGLLDGRAQRDTWTDASRAKQRNFNFP